MTEETELKRLYWEDRLTQFEIAKKLNVSQSQICKLMSKYNIQKRKFSELIKGRKNFQQKRSCTKEELKKLYLVQKLSTREIAKIFGVSQSTLIRWLKSDNISRRSNSESQWGKVYSPETEFKKGNIPWNKGKVQWQTTGEKNPSKRLEVRIKISQKLKGRDAPWVKGKSHTEESKKKMSEIRKQLWQNPEYARKILIHHEPNKQEQKLIEIIQKNNFSFIYVGDGKFTIEGKCPDFIDYDNKRIIELFGDYWHNKKIRNVIETEEGRKKFFAEHGFDTLVIWENELKNREEIENKIKGWIGNGNRL